MIEKVGRITINGSETAFGGHVYGMSYGGSFGPNPSTVEVAILSKSGDYLPVKLSYKTQYTINIGGNVSLKLYATRSRFENSTAGRTLNLTMVDGRVLMQRYLVLTPDIPCNSPVFIKIGDTYKPASNSQFGLEQQQVLAAQQNEMIQRIVSGGNNTIQTSESGAPQAPTGGQQGGYTYTYLQLKSASPIPLPDMPRANEFGRLDGIMTLADAFDQFCGMFGYTWYWDHDTDRPLLLDLAADIVLDDSILSTARTKPNFKGYSIEESLDGVEAVGTITMGNDIAGGGDENDTKSSAIVAINNLFDSSVSNFLGYPLVSPEDIEAAIYAMHGETVYNAYMMLKYPAGGEFLRKLGYTVDKFYNINDVENIPDLKTEISKKFSDSQFLETVEGAVVSVTGPSPKDYHFKLANALRSGPIAWTTWWNVQQLQDPQFSRVDPDTLVSQLPILNYLRDASKIQEHADGFPERRVGSLLNGRDLYTVNYNVSFEINLMAGDKPISNLPAFFDIPDGHKYTQVGTNQIFIVVLADPAAKFEPKLQFTGVKGWLSAGLDLGATAPAPSRSSGSYLSGFYGQRQCNIPEVNEYTSKISVNLVTNDLSSPNELDSFSYAPTGPAKTFSVSFYGLDTGLAVSPANGLDSFRIVMSDRGYESSYNFSTKKMIPSKYQPKSPEINRAYGA